MQKPITVVVADDHDLVRTGIIRMLSDDDGILVIGQASSGQEALMQIKKLAPDVLLLDMNMPQMDGVQVMQKLQQSKNTVKVLAVSAMYAAPYPAMLIKAGASGYITKGVPIDEMVLAIKKVAGGGRYFSPDVAEEIAKSLLEDGSPFDLLSTREKQVALMVANCQSITQIADALFVSAKTVNTYRYRIFEKLGVDSDVKLTHLAIAHGLVLPKNNDLS